MAKQNNRICIICGESYHFCPTCNSDSGKPAWHFVFDKERCNEIYEICVSYRDKVIDVKEAYERISKLDLSDLENFAPSTKAQIEEIMSYKKKTSLVEEAQEKDTAKANGAKNVKAKK